MFFRALGMCVCVCAFTIRLAEHALGLVRDLKCTHKRLRDLVQKLSMTLFRSQLACFSNHRLGRVF